VAKSGSYSPCTSLNDHKLPDKSLLFIRPLEFTTLLASRSRTRSLAEHKEEVLPAAGKHQVKRNIEATNFLFPANEPPWIRYGDHPAAGCGWPLAIAAQEDVHNWSLFLEHFAQSTKYSSTFCLKAGLMQSYTKDSTENYWTTQDNVTRVSFYAAVSEASLFLHLGICFLGKLH
jgi:hypothetical protein